MRIVKRLIASAFLTLLFFTATSQSSQWPKTLLWRISGKGLTKPSFLYGTMHLQDKRLFYFGDSLYKCLEQAEGYALEVDLREAMDSMLNKVFQKEEQEILNRDDKSVISTDSKRKKTIVDSLFKNVKKGDKESRKKLEQLRREQVENVIRMDMPTFVDAWLYGIARRQGKLIGAVEDVQDQLGIVDELGNKLDTADFMASGEKLRVTLEDMIKSYIAQDLNRIEDYDKNDMSEEMQEKLFRRRNIKMARRMDSLSHIHSFFFAVGAGHLPGDSGVINLLKRNGFTVEPVFSKQRIAPERYASKLNEIPWQTIEEQNKLYKIDMPEKATDFNMLGELVKMKVNIDITTMTYYMVGQTILNRDMNKMDDAFKEIAKNMGDPFPDNVKHITKDSIEGIEGIVNSIYGYYKLQLWHYSNALYMVMAGNEKKPSLFSGDIDRYFQSFTINKKLVPVQQSGWTNFTSDEKAFSVLFPVKPKRNKAYEKNAEHTNWDFNVFDCIDIQAGLYYMVQVRDIKAGYFLDGDSSFFEKFKSGMGLLLKDTVRDEQLLFKGFPALRFDGHSKEEEVFYRSLIVNRGNRVYILNVISSNHATKDEDVQKFFNSFTLTDYKHSELQKQKAADNSFYTTSSYPFTTISTDSLEDNEDERMTLNRKFVSYNPDEAVSYQVFKDVISPYKWYTNDSSLYGLNAYYNDDSVISFKQVMNGKLKGMERILYLHNNNNRKIIRKFLDGDTLYTLLSFIPSQYVNEERHRKFFEDFRVVNENTITTVFENKAEKLLKALLSKDSATFQQAKTALNQVSFSKENLPLLHKALLQTYVDDSIGYGVSNILANDLRILADSSTVDFIRESYKSQANNNEKLKYNLLGVLASYKSNYSYGTLKQLIISDPPAFKNGYYGMRYRLSDSLELCQSLYPEYLKLSANKYLWDGVAYNTNKLLDSNKISLNVVLLYKDNFLHSADTVLKSLRKLNDNYEGYEYLDLIELIGKFNDSRSNQLLQQYQKLKNVSLKQSAIVALLKNSQPADAVEINKLAYDKSMRNDFYDELKKVHKEKYFPVKYLTQRYFAESELYSSASEDDEEPSSVEYKGERIRDFNGSKQKFYLFKIVYNGDGDDPTSYLGVAGPYSISDAKNLKTSVNVTGVHYDKPYSAELLNELFERFIVDKEKSMKEHPEWYKTSE